MDTATWVLIVLASTQPHSAGSAMTSLAVPGFKTEQACREAGVAVIALRTQENPVARKIEALCVKLADMGK